VADVIQLLPDSVANQIAAGEVIQRPASVVKELVENSIDAGATKVIVYVKDSGRTLIQITDNGKGMSPTDARMAFERHATSKIREASDLFAIRTMGFRGEALASIASVADVELKTKPELDELGTFIHISGSQLINQESISCSTGTTFLVKNLFFNIPARRKFLKSNTTEIKHIINEIHRVALASPEVAFTLIHNDTTIFDLPLSNLRKRIVSLFGNTMNQSLVPVHSETSVVKIGGFVGQAKFARRTAGEQFFFVNGRYMRHPFFHRGIMQAYERILNADLIPSYFIYFEIDPATIDINIHPTKTEIKFESESAIWQLLNAAVRESLGKFNMVPSIDFDQSGSFDIPLMPRSTDGIVMPQIQYNPNYNPFEIKNDSNSSYNYPKDSSPDTHNWEKLYGPGNSDEMFFPTEDKDETIVQSSLFGESEAKPAKQHNNYIILRNRYILTPVKSGLMIIDQVRANQRILYEQFLIKLSNHEGVSQQLLFPQTFEINSSDAVLLRNMLDDLNFIGFDIREFGPDTFVINGVPDLLNGSEPQEVIELFIEEFKNCESDLKEKAIERIALSMAMASSAKCAHALNNFEAGVLIDCLFACQTPGFSPLGKPIVEIIPVEELEKRMK
jgi:DNA mismatch repair protein MutL